MAPVETRLRVRYAETDQMGVVYHANYLIWMEVGRVEYWRAAGLRYRDMCSIRKHGFLKSARLYLTERVKNQFMQP